MVEPRNWCVRCGEYDAANLYGICPVCRDEDRRKALVAASQQASNCRG